MSAREKLCLSCQKPVHGRSDKKFCDDYCRNIYNNRLRSHSNNYIRRINNALIKNRKILEDLLPETEEMTKVHEDLLLSLGFRFHYHTHIQVTRKGKQYVFSYEYGYLILKNKWYLVIRDKKEARE